MQVRSSDVVMPGASTTSSGHSDGLGRRTLAFDRAEGTMLERLALRPELAAFEGMLRERVDRVAALEDERIARPRTVERDADGSLLVVSEFVPGSRLSELLDLSADGVTAPGGVDAACGFLLDVLPALCGLHAGAGFPHGTITPSRTVLTPAGQVVLLDAVYGGALAHLRYSRRRLWLEFGIATPASAGVPRLDVDADIAQVALSGLMLILGRPLHVEDFPTGLRRLLEEAIEIAQIQRSAAFASGLQSFFERALPLPDRRPYLAADNALIELRDAADELGLQHCRRALVDFIERLDPSGAHAPGADDLLDIESFADSLVLVRDEDEDDEGDDVLETEIDVEELVEEEPPRAADAAPPEPAGSVDTTTSPAHAVEASDVAPAPPAEPEAPSVRSKRAKRTRSARARKDKLRSAASPAPLATQKEQAAPKPVPPPAPPPPATPLEPPAPAAPPAEARPVAAARDPKKEEHWLVDPSSAASFEPPVPAEQAAPRPVLPPGPGVPPAFHQQQQPPPPAFQRFAAPPPPPIPVQPAAWMRPVPAVAVPYPPAPPAPPFAPPPAALPPALEHAPSPPVPAAAIQASVGTVRLKEPVAKPRAVRPLAPLPDIYAPTSPVPRAEGPGAFPWKLAAGALIAMAVLIVVGRLLLARNDQPVKDAPDAVAAAAPRASDAPAVTLPATSGTGGRIEIETQPAGARVLLDGKPAGESPLALDAVPVGRHTVTFVTDSGSVKRTVRVEAGRTIKLDVPIFSGWVGIYAPFVMEVAENGRVIGTTEDPKLMLSPGRHDLTLTNRDLAYTSVQSVDIEPGELKSLTLAPQGTVNLNASPWAEVWIDGSKAGDTPLANLRLPLGIREITFKHPQYGERRATVTVKANAPAALSVDMTQP